MGWNIQGHTWAADMLQQHIANGNLRHAYLFSGPSGVGRRTLALRFAQAVNCTQSLSPGEPCGTCRTCTQIERMQYPDLAVVQAKDGGVLKVDQVRELQHTLSLSPYQGSYRVGLLLRFQEANTNAQNALLKTLEEPNDKVLLLATVNDRENLLPTIVSRCELLRLRPMAIDALAEVIQKEEHLPEKKAVLIAHVSSGRIGYGKQLAREAELLERRAQWFEDLEKLLPAGRIERLHYSEGITRTSKKKDRAQVKSTLIEGLVHWLTYWRDVLLMRTGSGARLTNIDQTNMIEKTAGEVPAEDIARVISNLEHAFKRLQSANLQLMLDNILLDWPVVHL